MVGSTVVAPNGGAPVIGAWIAACFPGGVPASQAGIEELIAEAAEAARNDCGVEAAIEWADGYEFPAEYMASDVRCLESTRPPPTMDPSPIRRSRISPSWSTSTGGKP